MRFSVISSGSKANCTLVRDDNTTLLIDCGLSCREATKRLKSLGVNPASIAAIVVTHEHTDHIRGIPAMCSSYDITVYANHRTAEYLSEVEFLNYFETGREFSIGSLEIHPFSVVHDAADPVGFVIRSDSGFSLGYATDLGRITPLVRESLRGCNALVLEANHDTDMLQQCRYPWELKRRIASTHGHISNDTSGALLAELSHPGLKRVVLAHISENSNNPEIALSTVLEYFKNCPERVYFEIECGSVYTATPLYDLSEGIDKNANAAGRATF